MNKWSMATVLVLVGVMTSCGDGAGGKLLENCPVVGKVVQVGDDQVIV